MRNACQIGLEKLEKWLPEFRLDTWKSIYSNILFAMILDPRFKNSSFHDYGISPEGSVQIHIEFDNLFQS